MATSSILKTFVISGEEAVSNFIDLLYSEPIPLEHPERYHIVEDPEEVRKIGEAWEKKLAEYEAEDKVKANGKLQ